MKPALFEIIAAYIDATEKEIVRIDLVLENKLF